jgi:hypothetical protein
LRQQSLRHFGPVVPYKPPCLIYNNTNIFRLGEACCQGSSSGSLNADCQLQRRSNSYRLDQCRIIIRRS